jgi:16S rRNA (guanine966-N2)-methyltransferase
MRITGGTLRGRTVRVPKGDRVRPTQNRVRQALFSSLGARICGSRFLDLFAGSGAVGIDAWSRGAAAVCWVESDRHVVRVLRENVEQLCAGPPEGRPRRIVCADGVAVLEKELESSPFDIIFADPPYGRGGDPGWRERLLNAIGGRNALKAEGVLVMEEPAGRHVDPPAGWTLTRELVHGDTALRFFAKKEDQT